MKIFLLQVRNHTLVFFYAIFLILTGVTFLALILDIYKYFGFFKKHFFIGSLTLFNLLLFFGLIISVFPPKKGILFVSRLERIFYRLNIILLPVLIITYVYFNNLLAVKGLNYIFSEYHIQPQNIPPLIFFSAFILFVYLYKNIIDRTD